MSDGLLLLTTRRLAECQYKEDGEGIVRGEFPMQLRGAVDCVDHNFLSGYALLHVACALHRGKLSAECAEVLNGVLCEARELPGRFQSMSLTANWYSGTPSGPGTERFRGPNGYPWNDRALHLRDDYDDTAICALLSAVAGLNVLQPFPRAFFERAAFAPSTDVLAPKSLKRLALTGCGSDVYTSWAFDGGDPAPKRIGELKVVTLPEHNSVELTTVANVATAARLLENDSSAQEASKRFVNRLARLALEKLIDGDASYLDFASSYYPRVPFAPLGYLARDHVLSGGWLLEEETLLLLQRSLLEVSARAGWRCKGFANPMYWLHCAAWSMESGIAGGGKVRQRARTVLNEILDTVSEHGDWPDIEFFYGAHLGNYSGIPFSRALAIETLALLSKEGLG